MAPIETIDIPAALPELVDLWAQSFGQTWPVDAQILLETLVADESAASTISLGVRAEARLIALAVGQHRTESVEASILVVCVAPGHRRRGLATALVRRLVEELRASGATDIRLGAGGASYLWPGIPRSCAAALPFFESLGWTIDEQSFDLVQDIGQYEHRLSPPTGVRFEFLSRADAPELLRFTSVHFPSWSRYYAQSVNAGRHEEVVVAKLDERIVGMTQIRTASDSGGHRWQRILGRRMGELGAVGVSESYRNRGIGLAMVDFATAEIAHRGVHSCLVGWTWLSHWYGRLGFEVWETYDMAGRSPAQASTEGLTV